VDKIIVYISHDEVNLDLARQLADDAGVLLRPLFVRDRLSDFSFDAFLCDLDCLPAAERAGILNTLLAGLLTCPVAVHSYSLGWAEDQALRAKGVAVSRRLDEGVVTNLVQATSNRPAEQIDVAGRNYALANDLAASRRSAG
jgi:hypothetical protein